MPGFLRADDRRQRDWGALRGRHFQAAALSVSGANPAVDLESRNSRSGPVVA